MAAAAASGENGAGPGTTTAVRRILTLGGHEFSSRPPDRAVCEFLLRLATERGGERPRICILPTASGDTSDLISSFYRPSTTGPASPPTSPSSASGGGRWRSATTCSRRT